MEQVAHTLPHPRLIAVELRPFAEDGTLIITPEGEMFQVDAPPAALARVLALCDGTRPLEEAAAASAAPDTFAEILAALAGTNCFSSRPPAPGEAAWARFAGLEIDPAAVAAAHLILLGDARLLALASDAELLPRSASVTVVERSRLSDTLDGLASVQPLVIALCEHLDIAFLSWLDDLCARSGVRWVQFHLDGGQGWLGPVVVPGRTARYRDLLVRRAAAADDPQIFDALVAAPLDAPPLPPTGELTWMLASFCTEIERWLAGAPCRILGAELRADPLTWQQTAFPVLPLPDVQPQGEPLLAGPPGVELLINERCGIITREVEVTHHPAVPAALKTVQLSLARMMVYDPTWHNDTLSGGSAFGDREAARRAAIGEAAERYCGNYFPGARPVRASYNELRADGEHAVDPEQLVLFSESMYRAPGFPFVPFTRDLPVLWVRGVSLTQGRPAWLPLQLVYVNWNVGGLAGEPLISSTFYPGLAAGTTLEQALAAGVQELIERDSMMVWWLNAQPLPAVRLPADLAALWEGAPTEHGQRAWAIPLPNEFGVPVMAGVVEDTRENLLNIGFACRPDPRAALLKAWTEALTLQEGSRDLLDREGLTRQGVAWNMVPDVLRPWRADRRYLDDFRTDFRDVADLLVQQQVFLDPRATERVRPWIDLPPDTALDGLPSLPDATPDTLRERVERRGFEVFAIDLTTPDVALGGLRVVRVLIPGLVPNFPAAFPPLGHGRVLKAAVALGWRTEPLAEDAVNLMPLPYA